MWQYYQPNPCGLSTGDCTVRAISKALDISWDEAHDILSEFAKSFTGTVQRSRTAGSTDTATDTADDEEVTDE